MTSVNDLLNSAGDGAPWAKPDTIGRQYAGTVLSVVERQATDYMTGANKFWDDGELDGWGSAATIVTAEPGVAAETTAPGRCTSTGGGPTAPS